MPVILLNNESESGQHTWLKGRIKGGTKGDQESRIVVRKDLKEDVEMWQWSLLAQSWQRKEPLRLLWKELSNSRLKMAADVCVCVREREREREREYKSYQYTRDWMEWKMAYPFSDYFVWKLHFSSKKRKINI